MQVAVLGLGNVIMGDDALGPHAIAALQSRYTFPEGVRVLDLGTPGGDLGSHMDGAEVVIVVDTVRADAPPGTVREYRREALLRHALQPRVSPHDPGLKDAILRADFEGRGPREVLLVGVVPGNTAQAVGLTAPVRAAIEPAVQAVVAELSRLGLAPTPVPDPEEPQLWWESAAAS